VCACALISLVGCTGGRSVTGKWSVSELQGQQAFQSVTADFAPGGQMTMVFIMELPVPGEPVTAELNMQGTYEHSGDEFTMNASDVQLKMNNFPPALKSQEEMLRAGFEGQAKQNLIGQINAAKGSKVTWVSDTSFQLTWGDGTMSFEKA
jgi:hypothetical protein